MFKDYYKLLGIPINATDDEIALAFRKSLLGLSGKTEKGIDIQAISEAYEFLSDKDKRHELDQYIIHIASLQNDPWESYGILGISDENITLDFPAAPTITIGENNEIRCIIDFSYKTNFISYGGYMIVYSSATNFAHSLGGDSAFDFLDSTLLHFINSPGFGASENNLIYKKIHKNSDAPSVQYCLKVALKESDSSQEILAHVLFSGVFFIDFKRRIVAHIYITFPTGLDIDVAENIRNRFISSLKFRKKSFKEKIAQYF